MSKIQESQASWAGALRQSPPIGNGAVTVARAQGALLALDQFLVFAPNTLEAIDRWLRSEQANPPSIDAPVGTLPLDRESS